MTEEKKIEIIVQDDFGRVQTRITTTLSPPDVMDKILEVLE